jgi:hypothetical protein
MKLLKISEETELEKRVEFERKKLEMKDITWKGSPEFGGHNSRMK